MKKAFDLGIHRSSWITRSGRLSWNSETVRSRVRTPLAPRDTLSCRWFGLQRARRISVRSPLSHGWRRSSCSGESARLAGRFVSRVVVASAPTGTADATPKPTPPPTRLPTRRSSGTQSFSIPPPDTPEVVRPPSGLQPAAMLHARWSGIHGSAYFELMILLSGRVGGEAKALAMRSKAIVAVALVGDDRKRDRCHELRSRPLARLTQPIVIAAVSSACETAQAELLPLPPRRNAIPTRRADPRVNTAAPAEGRLDL